MFKFLILVTVLALVASEEKDWFKGKWLQAVSYPNLRTTQCDWIEFSLDPTNECVCVNKTTPLVAMVNLKSGLTKAIPVINFEGMDTLQETLEHSCQCDNGKEEDPFVFRKINENYMVVYGRYISKQPEMNDALLLVRKVPKLSELRKVMSEIEDLSNRAYGISCEPNYFAKEIDNLDNNA